MYHWQRAYCFLYYNYFNKMTRNAANEAQHGKAESASSVHALSITTDESLCPHSELWFPRSL